MKPLISIIVPVYNVEKYVARCVDSLLRQTYSNLEIILINDGSKDKSGEICKEFHQKDSRIVYIEQRNQGVSSARNSGLKVARGNYIAFCDSDDWVEPDMYESLYNAIQKGQADVAIQSMIIERNGTTKYFCDDDSLCFLSTREAIKEMLLGKKFGGHLWNKMIKRSLLDGLSFLPNIALCEDVILMLDVFFKSEKIVFQNIHKYHYEQRDSSAIYCFKETSWSQQDACDIIYQKTLEHFPDLMIYAKKMMISGNWMLVNLLYRAKLLNKSNYQRVKQQMASHINRETLLFFPKKSRILIKIYLKSRIFYLFTKKMIRE